ncbi:MAG: hypothetical protein M3Q48_16140, partial [Actinomycetota bacterium]|nr:hypothetical protein [Actinomycetota bacterium]
MFGLAKMREIREGVAAYAAGFDPGLVSAADAQRIVEDAAAAENMLDTVKAMAARRVAETELWRCQGDRSAAHHLARTSGTSVGRAREALETAARLADLPAVDAAARRGELSPSQAAPIADAASKAPAAEQRLVQAAKEASLGELLDACARTKAAAEPDDEARHRAIHASRYVRRRRSSDGAGELLYRSTLEEVAEVFAIVQGYGDRAFRTARAAGRREPGEAYLADGLLEAVRAARAPRTSDGTEAAQGGADCTEGGVAPTGPVVDQPGADAGAKPAVAKPPSPAKVLVHIDWDAFIRGWPIDGEVCEIAGLGPVPV